MSGNDENRALDAAQDPLLATILAELVARHGVHTVILYGSRARGDARAHSDYDLATFRDGGEPERDARVFQGAYLDAWVYPAETARAAAADFIHVRDGLVLLEQGTLATDMLARVRSAFAAGPEPLKPWDIELRHVWMRKMLDRIDAGRAEASGASPGGLGVAPQVKNDPEGDYRRHWLLVDGLKDWFELRGKWYLGPKESLAWLAAHDPNAHALFVAALAPGAPLDAIAALVAGITATFRSRAV